MHHFPANMDSEQNKPTRFQHPGDLREGARYLIGAKMNDGVEGDDPRHLCGRKWQIQHVPLQKDNFGMSGTGFPENARREIKADHVCVETAQVFRNMSGTTTQITNKTVARRGKFFQQISLQWPMIELAGNLALIGSREGIIIGTDFAKDIARVLIHGRFPILEEGAQAARVMMGSNS